MEETSLEVLKTFWAMQTDFLSRAREYSRNSFLKNMGFLFVSCNLSLVTSDKEGLIKSIMDIPLSCLPEREKDRYLCVKKNTKQYKKS